MTTDSTPIMAPLWTIEDTARFLRLEESTVRLMARKGQLPAIKVGRQWRFNQQDMQRWIEQMTSNQQAAGFAAP